MRGPSRWCIRPTISAQDPGDGLPQSRLVSDAKRPKLPDDESVLDGGEDRFDDRWLEQACSLPAIDEHLARSGRGTHLTRDGHYDEVRPSEAVGVATDDDRGPFL